MRSSSRASPGGGGFCGAAPPPVLLRHFSEKVFVGISFGAGADLPGLHWPPLACIAAPPEARGAAAVCRFLRRVLVQGVPSRGNAGWTDPVFSKRWRRGIS